MIQDCFLKIKFNRYKHTLWTYHKISVSSPFLNSSRQELVRLWWYQSAPQALLGTALTNPLGNSLLPVPTDPPETEPHWRSISWAFGHLLKFALTTMGTSKYHSNTSKSVFLFWNCISFPPVCNISASAGVRAGAVEGSVVYQCHLLSPPVPLWWAGLRVAKQMSTVSHCSSTNPVCPGIVSH